MRGLRIIDFGRVSALRSQTLWHAIALGVSDGSPPTLSFMTPAEPYVSIGLHRRLEEVDQDWCRAQGLPIFRREVGGGPVYLDDGQLFFQITIQATDAPPVRSIAVNTLLEPAISAFRTVGIEAGIDAGGDIVVGDTKICGHGAGQIDQAVIVVGNLITRFDHAAAAATLSSPTDHCRAELERLMRRYIAPTPTDPAAFRDAAVHAYGKAIGLDQAPGELTEAENEHLAELDSRFVDPDWLEDQPNRASRDGWMVKIKGGVWIGSWSEGKTRVTVSMAGPEILHVTLDDARLNGQATEIEKRLVGGSLEDARRNLAELGSSGRRLIEIGRAHV